MEICTSPVTPLKTILEERQAAIVEIAALKVVIKILPTTSSNFYFLTPLLRAQLALETAKLAILNTRFQAYLLVLDTSQMTTVAQQKSAIALFEISLSVGDSLTCSEWDSVGNGERITEVYIAIVKIIQAIARGFAERDNQSISEDYLLKGAIQFIDSFGGTELRIIAGNDVLAPSAYAITNPNGIVISLWNNPVPLLTVDVPKGYPLHNSANLMHEFGHVLDFRTGGQMFLSEWQVMRGQFARFIMCNEVQISSAARGFDLGEGWDISKRQNTQPASNFEDCFSDTINDICQNQATKDNLCFHVEIERIADMFLFWVNSEDSAYAFDTNNSDSSIQDRAIALNTFSNGGLWSRNTVNNLSLRGFLNWIENAVRPEQ